MAKRFTLESLTCKEVITEGSSSKCKEAFKKGSGSKAFWKIQALFEHLPKEGGFNDEGKITFKGVEISEKKVFKLLTTIKKHAELEKLSLVQCSTDNNPEGLISIEYLIFKIDAKGIGIEGLQKIIATFEVLKQFDIDGEWEVTLAGDMYQEKQSTWWKVLGMQPMKFRDASMACYEGAAGDEAGSWAD